MANVYVRSLAAGTGTGADWTNAFTTLAAALTAKAAGDSFWVSEDHAETQASAITLAAPGTAANPVFIYCVNHAGSVPPVSADLATAATVSTTGANSISFSGSFQVYGITFNAGNSTNAASINLMSGAGGNEKFIGCALVLNNTSSSSLMQLGNIGISATQYVLLENTTMQFGAVGQSIATAHVSFVWRNTASALAGATFPTALFTNAGTQRLSTVSLDGVDLSALGSGKTIVNAINLANPYTLKDCKLGASVTVAATPSGLGPGVLLVRSDSAATNYRSEKYQYTGTETTETTIVRTGGASDGTTTIAKKIVTTANSRWVLPFEAIPIAIWNDSTSAITTLTIYGTTTGGGVPNNDDIWVDVEYPGSALTPQGSFITSTKADNLAASGTTNNSSDASTWGGGGAGNGFKIVVPSFTPGMMGTIYITVKAAKASSTYYIDPKPSISGITVSKSEILAPGVYANELQSAATGGGISRARAASGF